MADLMDGKASISDYERMVNEHKPIEPYETVPIPASRKQMEKALASNKVEQDRHASAATSRRVRRSAFDWISLHIQITVSGSFRFMVRRAASTPVKVIRLRQSVAQIKNATFGSRMKRRCAEGCSRRARNLRWLPSKGNGFRQILIARKGLQRTYSPVMTGLRSGSIPERHSYFWDRYSLDPVVAADEVVQVGPLVLAKNPKLRRQDRLRLLPKNPQATAQARQGQLSPRPCDCARLWRTVPPPPGSKFGALINVRQISEQIYHILPTIQDEYVADIQRMETIKNRFKNRAGKIAERRRKNLDDIANDQLSKMQHEATIAGVDPIGASMSPSSILSMARERVIVLKQRIFGRPGSDKTKLMDEVKHRRND